MLTPKIQKLKNLEKQEDIIQKQKILLQKEIQEDREFQKKIEENNSILNLKTLLKKNYKIIQNKNLPNNYSIVLYQLKRDYQKKKVHNKYFRRCIMKQPDYINIILELNNKTFL